VTIKEILAKVNAGIRATKSGAGGRTEARRLYDAGQEAALTNRIAPIAAMRFPTLM